MKNEKNSISEQQIAASGTFFTLLELLIVVAIIAILAGILLPSLQKAMRTGKKISCTSNLRQIGQRISMYAGMFNDFLCPVKVPGATGMDPGYRGQDQSMFLEDGKTGKVKTLAICPEDSEFEMQVHIAEGYIKGGWSYYSSYGCNGLLIGGRNTLSPEQSYKLGRIQNPSRGFSYVDAYSYQPMNHNDQYLKLRHLSGVNFVFLDGHAAYTGTQQDIFPDFAKVADYKTDSGIFFLRRDPYAYPWNQQN